MAGCQLQLQMTWQQSLKKRKNGPPVGFRNLGNTCYLNSVLQCLTYTPPLANFCLQFQHSANCDSISQQDKKNDCPFCLIEKRIVRSLSIDATLDAPGKIIGGLKLFAEHFRLGRQEDAHEFLRYVIDACHTTCLRLKKLQQQRRKYVTNGGGDGFGGSTVVKEIFGGALQSQVKCLGCGYESNKVDEIMDISVDVINTSTLKEAFQKFFQSEILDGSNKYKCDSCKKLVAAKKQMSILQAPNILVVQLKRFEGIYGGKIDKAISFEEVLVLSNFMCKTSQDFHPEYKLFATIVHSGFSPDSGHYYAYIKDAIGRWYCCNDSYVSVSSLQEVFSEKVYILFFSRTKQRPALPNITVTTNGTAKPYDCNGTDSSKILKSSQIVKSSGTKASYDCNGNDTSKISKPGLIVKPSADTKECVNHQPPKVDSTKASKIFIGPQRKPVSFGNFGAKKVPGLPNLKIIVHNKENNGNNGDAKSSSPKKTSDKKLPLLEDKNGIRQSKSVANGNGEIHRNGDEFVANGCKSNGTRNGTATVKMSNGIAKNIPDKLDLKRKHEEQNSRDLPSEDRQSPPKREILKETLEKEASSFLRNCGFLEEVESCVRATKLCVQDKDNDSLSRDELKRKMISDAKTTLISKIPEALKTNLIKRIRTHIDP
ncbi:ubiquitin carboxyl-terminal hydrolase 25 [Rutidosis leptorrhynchoides]|uniref:ubiquitin carboxyl-terminal hydrolase 25 n=1 Tax=Rutidosis leptorrhynchoides TaxID=125765 RepID=UPI003A9A1083